MTWLIKKSHGSSAPSNAQGRDGARPPHSSGAAVPHTGPAVVGPAAGPPSPSGRLGAQEAPDPPDSSDPPGRPGAPARPDVAGPRDGAREPADSAPEHNTSSTPASGSPDADHDSAIRAAKLNAAFRSATRNVWPGTENRQAEGRPAAPAAEPQPHPAQPGEPGLSSYGPLGAGAQANRQIWEPRRLHQVPHLRRPSPKPSVPRSGPPSGEHAAPPPPPQAPPSRRDAPRPHRDIPVNRVALPAGSGAAGPDHPDTPGGPAPGPRRRKRREANQPNGPAYLARNDWDGTDHKADRLKLGDLMADTRMRIWKRRLLVAVIAGLIFTFVFTWRAGVTAAVLAAIADAIWRSRTTASMPPGVRLTGAQKRTQRQLARMERVGYRALHSRPIPGSPEFIDHFVVGPTGAYAIDSEAWDKRLPIRTRNARQLWHGPFSKKDRLEHARWEAQQASERLTAELGHAVYVRPVLAVYGPKVPWNVATIRDVDVFNGDRLRKYLRRNAMLRERPRLSSDEIEQIYAAAARVLPLSNAAQRTPVG